MTRDADFKALVRERMRDTGEGYTAAREMLLAQRDELDRFRDKTIRTFFDGEALRSVPVKRKARVVVLLELLARFEPGRDYPEREVNDILRTAHPDVAYLRRELVDYGYLVRDHGIYRVAEALTERDPAIMQETPPDEVRRFREARAAGAAQGGRPQED